MADVTIINAPPQVPNAPASGSQAPTATSSPSLPAGSTVSGTIVGKDPGGNFILRTDQGNIALKSSTPLTYNSDVTIRISNSNAGGTGARILSVNGTDFSDFSTAQEPESDSVSTALLTQNAAPAAPVAEENATLPGTAVRAVIISAPVVADSDATSTSSGTANTPQLVSGTAVTLRIADTPQNVTQQAVVATGSASPAAAPGNAPSSSTAQAQTQLQQVGEAQTPATVGQVVAPQAAQIQQNAPANVALTIQTPPEAETATAPAASQTAPSEAPPNSLPQLTLVPAADTVTAAPAIITPAATSTTTATAVTDTPVQTPPTTSATSSAQYAAYAKQPTAEAPAVPAAPATSAAPPTTSVPAQVVSTATDGTVTLQTPQGTLTAQTEGVLPATLTPGAAITIELPTAATALTTLLTPASFSSQPASLSELATSWTTLKDIATVTTTGTNPTAPATGLLAQLPQLGADFIPSSLAFIASAIQGDARRILGDATVDSLRENGRADLLEKFSGELSNISQGLASQPAQHETPQWQALLLPFMFQEEIQQARLYVKRDGGKKERGKESKNTQDTRFIVEVDLSELGPLQMDGLVKSKEQTTAFDLVIRSRTAFSPSNQADIQHIYQDTAELTGFKGSLSFQVVREFSVKPLEEIAAATVQSIMA